MLCASCRFDNPPQNRFCEQCGAALEVRCAQCGAPLRPGARFCGGCGQRLTGPEPEVQAPAPKTPVTADYQSRLISYTPKHLAEKILKTRSALEGERWQVTVLFADIAGFTALAEKLDPEEVHRIIDRCFELDEAWAFAEQSLQMATDTDSRKHVARAQRLQGEILAARGSLDESARILDTSVRLAEAIGTPREIWLGKAALGKVLAQMGRDKEAETQLSQAVQTTEGILGKLQTPGLRHSFVSAEPVQEIYRAVRRKPPEDDR